MAASASEAVDVVMRDYIATLAAKDNDIFNVYEDNKRMRALVEEGLRAREDADTRHRTTLLLVDSLRAELQEKRCLIEAQDKEAATLRDAITNLRVVLALPSELDSTPADIANEVEAIVGAHEAMKKHAAEYKWRWLTAAQLAVAALSDAEHYTRSVLAVSAMGGFDIIMNALGIVTTAQQQFAGLEEGIATVLELKKHEATEEAEHHRLELEYVEQEHARARRSLENTLQGAQTSLMTYQNDRGRQSLYIDALLERVHLLTARCATAEQHWLETVIETMRVSCEEAARHARHAAHLCEQQKALRESLEQERATVEKVRAQLDKKDLEARKRREEDSAMVAQLEALKAAHEELKGRYSSHLEKEQRAKPARAAAAEDMKKLLAAKEEKIIEMERKEASLQGRLESVRGTERSLRKEITQVKSRLIELEPLVEHLAECKVREATLQEKVKAAVAAVEATRATGEEERVKEVARALAQVEEVEREKATLVAQVQADADAKALEASEERDELLHAHAQSEAQFKQELHAWAEMTEQLQSELAAKQRLLEQEQTVRSVLEQQQANETVLVRRLMDSVAESYIQEDELAKQSEECADLRHQVQVLEQACRKSVSVIAELRESLYRERMQAGTCFTTNDSTGSIGKVKEGVSALSGRDVSELLRISSGGLSH